MLNNAESAKSIIVGDSELIEDTEDTDEENENIKVLANNDDKENTKHVPRSNRAIKEVKGNIEEKVDGQNGKKKEKDTISNEDDK